MKPREIELERVGEFRTLGVFEDGGEWVVRLYKDEGVVEWEMRGSGYDIGLFVEGFKRGLQTLGYVEGSEGI
jgi:hypothetical protein